MLGVTVDADDRGLGQQLIVGDDQKRQLVAATKVAGNDVKVEGNKDCEQCVVTDNDISVAATMIADNG